MANGDDKIKARGNGGAEGAATPEAAKGPAPHSEAFDKLIEKIKTTYSAALKHREAAVAHEIKCGEYLMTLKQVLKGTFKEEVTGLTGIPYRTAARYMAYTKQVATSGIPDAIKRTAIASGLNLVAPNVKEVREKLDAEGTLRMPTRNVTDAKAVEYVTQLMNEKEKVRRGPPSPSKLLKATNSAEFRLYRVQKAAATARGEKFANVGLWADNRGKQIAAHIKAAVGTVAKAASEAA